MIKNAIVAGAIIWPVLLGSVLWTRADGAHPPWTALVYLAAGRICHQRPERSFQTAGVQWPVCARCSGLYASAPFGALLAMALVRRRRPDRRADRRLFVIAAIPTALTLVVEWTGLSPLSNTIRAVSALPLGAAIAFLLVRTAEPAGAIG